MSDLCRAGLFLWTTTRGRKDNRISGFLRNLGKNNLKEELADFSANYFSYLEVLTNSRIMAHSQEKIDAFFHDYAERFNNALEGKETDIEGAVHAFSDCFIESSPLGVICAKNDDSLKQKLSEGFEFYKKIGTTCMVITAKDVTVLDDCHVMVKVHWKANYEKGAEGQMIEFSVFYFLNAVEEDLKIFAYITGDEQKLLKERGILPKD